MGISKKVVSVQKQGMAEIKAIKAKAMALYEALKQPQENVAQTMATFNKSIGKEENSIVLWMGYLLRYFLLSEQNDRIKTCVLRETNKLYEHTQAQVVAVSHNFQFKGELPIERDSEFYNALLLLLGIYTDDRRPFTIPFRNGEKTILLPFKGLKRKSFRKLE